MIDRSEHLRFDFRILIFQNRFLTFEPVIDSVCRSPPLFRNQDSLNPKRHAFFCHKAMSHFDQQASWKEASSSKLSSIT